MALEVSDSPDLDSAALADLARSFRGELIAPDHPAYEEQRRVWNGSIDRRPALIARCRSADDVVAAVATSRAQRPARSPFAAVVTASPACPSPMARFSSTCG
jgi:hypothetical protein